MSALYSPVVIAVAIALTILTLRRPWAGLTFVILGAVPYYAILDVVGAEPSAVTTGAIFGGIGVVAVARLTIRGRQRFPPLQILLPFALFVLIWYVRWYQDPPILALDGSDAFGERSRIFMIAFAVVPFLGGLSVIDDGDLEDIIQCLAAWGALALIVSILYWVTGRENTAEALTDRWHPIPHLTGIILSFDLGTGCLACLALCEKKNGVHWKVLRWAWSAAAIAIMVRVGERGPFVFLLLSLCAYLLMKARHTRLRGFAFAGLALAFLVLIAFEDSGAHESTRTIDTTNYTAESNQDRIGILTLGLRLIAEKPLLGWGGSLVGMPVGIAGRWDYIHATLLDPLLEAGVIGALPYWLLCAIILHSCVKHRSIVVAGIPLQLALAPLLLYTFTESQVSGHLSGAKHMWFVMGLVGSVTTLLERRSRDVRVPVSRSEHEVQLTSRA